ncbi:MAG: hypothetical protein Aurels2KO_44060 [Aureliella sp.]
MPPHPLLEAMDADQDGEFSLQELTNAPKLLKRFDADKNGKISMEEVRPDMGGMQGRRGAQTRQRGGRPGQGDINDRPNQTGEGRDSLSLGGPEGRGPGGGPEGRGPGGRGPGGPGGERNGGPGHAQSAMTVHPERMQSHAMEFDADKDGKLSADELKAFIADFAKVHGGNAQQARGNRGRPSSERSGAAASGDRPARPKS